MSDNKAWDATALKDLDIICNDMKCHSVHSQKSFTEVLDIAHIWTEDKLFFSFTLVVFLSLVYLSSSQSSLRRIKRTSNWQTKEWNLASTWKASEKSQISWKFLTARFWKDVLVIVENETRRTTAPELKDGNIKKSTLKLMYLFVTDKPRTRWKIKTINSHKDGWLHVWIDFFFLQVNTVSSSYSKFQMFKIKYISFIVNSIANCLKNKYFLKLILLCFYKQNTTIMLTMI